MMRWPSLLAVLPLLTSCGAMGPLLDQIPVTSNDAPSRLQGCGGSARLHGASLADAIELLGCPSFSAAGGRFHVWAEWRPRSYNLRGIGIDFERFLLAVELDADGRIVLVRLWRAEADDADAFVQELVAFTTRH